MKRIESIDAMRGFAMIILALDHVRDMMHTTSITLQPTDLLTTTPALFLTRWITHICAPTFVFLSGTSAFISMKKRNDIAASKMFLVQRGVWLVVLEFTVVNFGLWFDVRFSVFLFDVIATVGVGFIILALVIKLPEKIILAIGLLIIFLHNLTPLAPGKETSLLKQVLMPFFAPAAYPFGNGKLFVIGYSPIPWLGIMLIGFASGKMFLLDSQKQSSRFFRMGLTAIALFFIFRGINMYGDSVKWSVQKNNLYTVMSFANLTKYPPSLDFTLFFLGMMFLVLSRLQQTRNWFTGIASVYGKVPLFYFIVHFYIIHSLVFAMVFLQGFRPADLVFGFNLGRPPNGSGIPLWAVYLVWVVVVLSLYPLCKWYGAYKSRHKEKRWLRYV